MIGPRRILWIRTDRLGETVLTLPVVTALRRLYPNAEITLLVHPEMAALLEGLPDAADIWRDEPGTSGLWWQRATRLADRVRAGRFDLALACHPRKEVHAALWLAGVPRRVGYARKWGWCLTHRVLDRKHLGWRHEVDYNLDLVRALGEQVFAPGWRLPAYHRERAELRQRLAGTAAFSGGPTVVVHPWTSDAKKQWPIERFRELIRLISAQAPVVVAGGPEFAARAKDAVPADAPGVTDLTGRTTLRELAALLHDAELLVSNDSGPVHLAAALGTKTVALFGGEDPATGPGRWGPWGAGHTVISRPRLEDIPVDDVAAAVYKHLHVRV